MLRDHLRRVETVLSRIDGSLAALEVAVKSIGEEMAHGRRDDTPPARPSAMRIRTATPVVGVDIEEFSDQPTRAVERSNRFPKVPR
jgi:hypothetical protein